MKRLINRLICLCRGHKWEYSYFQKRAIHEFPHKSYKCARCGKIKEEVI